MEYMDKGGLKMNGQIEKLELELAKLMHEQRINKFPTKSNAYMLLLTRQSRILGALACLRGEQV